MNVPREDLVHFFPAFAGTENIGRFLCLYEIYKRVLGVLGHIAEIGTWKGASFLFFAKLIQLFEPKSVTQIHGFDWFKGMRMSEPLDDQRYEGAHAAEYAQLKELVDAQGLSNIAFVHQMNVITELRHFLKRFPSLQFKLVFLDCGALRVLRESIRRFWPRLTKGGIMVFDHANLCSVKAEGVAIREFFGESVALQTMPFTSWPSGYIIKE